MYDLSQQSVDPLRDTKSVNDTSSTYLSSACISASISANINARHLNTKATFLSRTSEPLFINGYIYNGLSMVPQSCVVSFLFSHFLPFLSL